MKRRLINRHRSSFRGLHYLVRRRVLLDVTAGYTTDCMSAARLCENRLSPYARTLVYMQSNEVFVANTCNNKIVILDTALRYISYIGQTTDKI